ILPLLNKKRRLNLHFSLEGSEELTIYHLKMCKQISRIHNLFAEIDAEKIGRVIQKMNNYISLEDNYRRKHIERLREKVKESIDTHEIHMELMDYLKQINVYTGNIAKVMSIYTREDDSDLTSQILPER
ncbi:MAG: hypothetical protein HQK50_10325, partial [Oligoflexia bacterium]|nr:hypothetical protein [Oligoflexia bacterium]